MQNKINEIINKKFNTDKGYLYIAVAINRKWPYFNINEENLKNLSIVNMPEEYFKQTGFVGEYVARENKIKLYPGYTNEEELLETFMHELVHAVTSKILGDVVLEGINMRNSENVSSYFVYLNEGITQYITNEILGISKSDAYPFPTNIAEQFICILGEEEILTAYSNQDFMRFVKKIENVDSECNFRDLIEKIWVAAQGITYISPYETFVNPSIITEIQQHMINLYRRSEHINDEKFQNLILDSKKAEEIINPPILEGKFPKLDINQYGFEGIDEVDKKIYSNLY